MFERTHCVHDDRYSKIVSKHKLYVILQLNHHYMKVH